MLQGQKILISGASGNIGLQFGAFLARDNDVWGLARFSNPATRDAVVQAGVTPVAVDLAQPDFANVPDDFDYLLHLSHVRLGGDQFPEAIQVNAVGAGLLLQHCRKAKAALVMSSTAVYSPQPDVFQPLSERGDIGRAWAPWAPSSPVSKVSLEAVARFAAEAFDLPVTVARLNTYYGPQGGLPVMDLEAVMKGQPVRTFADPYPHSPIHIDDMLDQIEPMLRAAGVPANVVNWCGDEAITQRTWCEQVAELSGRPAELIVNRIPGAPEGNVGDPAKRRAITGPCRRPFRESLRAIYEARAGAVAQDGTGIQA